MTKDNRTCLQCGSGKMYRIDSKVPDQKTAENPEVDVKVLDYEEFQCDICGFKEGRTVAAFIDKQGILSANKQIAKRKTQSKGQMKKEKDAGKRRRQEPR